MISYKPHALTTRRRTSLVIPEKTIIAAASLAALLPLEWAFPFFPGRRDRLRHGLRNLSRNRMQTLDITGGAPELNPHKDQTGEELLIGGLASRRQRPGATA